MSKQTYVVLVKEQNIDGYVLPDGAHNLSRVQELMAFRAEELLEELDEQEVEAGGEPGNLTINTADNHMWLTITKDEMVVARMEIQAISLVD